MGEKPTAYRRLPGAVPPHAASSADRPRTALPDPRDALCQDPVSRALLVPYALGTCSDAEAEGLEAHLLACETCFQDLKVLDRAGALLRAYADSGARGLDRLRTQAGPAAEDPRPR